MDKRNGNLGIECEIVSGHINYTYSEENKHREHLAWVDVGQCDDAIEDFIFEIKRRFEQDKLDSLTCSFNPFLLGGRIRSWQTRMTIEYFGCQFRRLLPDEGKGLSETYYDLDRKGLICAWLDHLADLIDIPGKFKSQYNPSPSKVECFKLYRQISLDFLNKDPFDKGQDPFYCGRYQDR